MRVDIVADGRDVEHVVDVGGAVGGDDGCGEQLEEVSLAVVEAASGVLCPQGDRRGDGHAAAGHVEIEEPELGETGEAGAAHRDGAGGQRLPVGEVHAVRGGHVVLVREHNGRARRGFGEAVPEIDRKVVILQRRGAVELEPEREVDLRAGRAGQPAGVERNSEHSETGLVVGQVDRRRLAAEEFERGARDVDVRLDGPSHQVDHYCVEQVVAVGGELAGDEALFVDRHGWQCGEDLGGRCVLVECRDDLCDLRGADR